MVEALRITVKGIVQGVGFRPFVYRLAKRYLINGWVLNAVDGVTIHAEGESQLLDEFVLEISENAPAAAHVERILLKEVPLEDFTTFEIRFSDDAQVQETTLVSPDLATCDDCVRELFDPANRRYRYPFINCTNCGPRFTIIDKLPYDRASTSMSAFEMCPDCAREYHDPADRRFHAQPDACFACGPQVSWIETADNGAEDAAASPQVPRWGDTRAHSDVIFARAVEFLLEGKILAVKGLGGFHLVCDAANPDALEALRSRKHRDGKAFAVMVPSVEASRAVCEVNEVEQQQLESPERPIVLVRKRPDATLAKGLADDLPELGVMLPATPVQHLLIHDFIEAGGGGMLVMTSGNVHDEPIVIDDAEAVARLGGIADAILGNNRAIRARYDDSVLRVLDLGGIDERGQPRRAVQFLRRARGFAPAPLVDAAAGGAASRAEAPDAAAQSAKAADAPCIFAAGPEQKNTFAIKRGAQTFVSQHIGDMENADIFDAWLDAKARFQTLFEARPTVIACDDHPEYLSTKWAHEQGLPLISVQHHHAHIASVLGEYGIDEAVCGIAFDGTGYGADGAIWGGEALLANRRDFERFVNFAYVPMPGGAAAVKRPLRMAYGALWAFDLLEHPAAQDALATMGTEARICDQMIEQGINTPLTSSVGRLFDAAAALTGVCTAPTYEGEAAILFDAVRAAEDPFAATPEEAAQVAQRYAISIVKNAATEESTARDTSVLLLDCAPTFEALLNDMASGVPAAVISLRFHRAFVDAIVTLAQLANALYGVGVVALSGGVFMNRYLIQNATARLAELGFTVALNSSLPPNDGCISYGQAVVAAALADERA